MYNSIKPGQTWFDTEGKKIHAHGGSVIFIDGLYYWYGENKEKSDGKNGIWHWGVRCYSSKDLYNWKDCGIIIPPNVEDESSSLHPTSCMDRPHIIYNEKTGKYVCWLKIECRDRTQAMTVLTSDNFLGPYTVVKEWFYPFGFSCGDFDFAIGPDKKAYWYFEKVHSEIICAELDDEYTGVNGVYSRHFPQPYPPFVREAPAHFEYDGKHFLITSGTTGYYPNPSEVAVADNYHGPFKVLGESHIGDKSHTSFHSQISCIFKVQGKKDLFIAMADRWIPDLMYVPYEEVKELYALLFCPDPDNEKIEEYKKNHEWTKIDTSDVNTSKAEYVWLPITFNNGRPEIRWHDEWKTEDYE